MSIWVLKDGQREGPYEEQDIRELIYEGTYTGDDPAIRGGQFDWTTLGQLLNREPAEESPEAPEPPPMPVAPADAPPMPGAQPEAVESAALTAMPAAVDGGPLRVAVVDFQMPFASVLMLMLKWALAWMLVMAALGFLAAIAWAFFLAVIVSAAHR